MNITDIGYDSKFEQLESLEKEFVFSVLPQAWNTTHDINYCRYYEQTIRLEDEEHYMYNIEILRAVAEGLIKLDSGYCSEINMSYSYLN